MTNTIRWYDRGWNERAAITIGGSGRGNGVYFDGHDYWIVDTATGGTIQQYRLEGGAFSLIQSTVITSLSPTGSYSVPWGITGDGHDLYLGMAHTVSGPPFAVSTSVAKLSKQMVVSKELLNTEIAAAISQGVDLDWDGQRLIRCMDRSGAGTQHIELIDTDTDTMVFQSPDIARFPEAMTFDGLNFPTVSTVGASHRGYHLDINATILTNFVVLAGQAYGATWVSNPGEGTVPEQLDGEAIAVLFRA